MPRTSRSIASALVGGVMLLGTGAFGSDRRAVVAPRPAAALPTPGVGSLEGVVQDERGRPVDGAAVSAVGATTITVVTDRRGRFEMSGVPPGAYLVRARLEGFTTLRPQMVRVAPSARASSQLSLRRNGTATPVLLAGVADLGADQPAAPLTPASDDPHKDDAATTGTTDHSELAWRLRHARRSVLKDAVLPVDVLAADAPPSRPGSFAPVLGSSAHAATGFFTETPFSGQVNLLTSASFDTPEQLFAPGGLSRGTAYVRVSAPVGDHADWTVRGALTQADLSAWIVAGSYTTREAGRHQYNLGLSYSTQRYDGGNSFALREVTDGSRNVGTVYGFDTLALSPSMSLSYGAQYGRYDYLLDRSLLSSRAELTMKPSEGVRISTLVSRRAVAPGAEEFLPPSDEGVWLPPQRTFSTFTPEEPLEAERATHVGIGIERDLARATVGVRAFHQHVSDQMATLFGAELPGQPASRVGHYFVANAGSADASGVSAELRLRPSSRIHGAIEYSFANADMTSSAVPQYLLLLAPSAVRTSPDRIHSLSTSLNAEVPETATRLVVLYRVGNGFARSATQGLNADRSGIDSRFDIQIRQSLPFLDFSNARWEMLVAVRNFFHEAAAEQSVYDELLVVRPPKRIVGGLTLHF
jgi:hypothetical protein